MRSEQRQRPAARYSVVRPPQAHLEDLIVPADARGRVVFIHGSSAILHSDRNEVLARRLFEAHYATHFATLLDETERADYHNLFNVDFLAERLIEFCRRSELDARTRDLPVGFFGIGTGASVALAALAREPRLAAALVCRSGRPDLALSALHRVATPTLFIVGGRDPEMLHWNRDACHRMAGTKELVVVPGAGSMFEEPGTMEQAIAHTRRWFDLHLEGRAH